MSGKGDFATKGYNQAAKQKMMMKRKKVMKQQ
jgi:hypothetical protein